MAEVPSAVERVTFFEDRAEVLRRATLRVGPGITRAEVAGVSPVIDDASLTAGVRGEAARVLAARVLRRERELAVDDDPAAALAALDAAEDACAAARARVERAGAEVERLRAAERRWAEGFAKVPRGDDGDAEAGAREWRGALETYAARVTAALDREAEARRALDDASDAWRMTSARVSATQARAKRWEAVVEVQVEAEAEADVVIDVQYRVPCALWRPEHHARLDEDTVTLTTWATAWQATGEDWEGVRARFSTARPAQAAAAPMVTDDVLTSRRKSDAERRVVVADVREQAVASAGLDRGVRAVESMPGVDDGGEVQCFEAAGLASLPSDGAPHRVEVGSVTLPCEVDRVAWPERSEAVHVRATATLKAPYPLLAGPVRVARGTEVTGRGATGYVGRGDVFELGFGVDGGLRVRRTVDVKRETTPVTGTRKATRTVKVFVSNLSDEHRALTVTERVPVSEIEDVAVEVVSLDGGRVDDDGLVRWTVSLEPRATETRTLVYRVEAAAKVVMQL